MNNNEFKIILSLEEFDKINEKIKNIENEQIILKNKISIIENKKNIFELFLSNIRINTENLMLYLFEFIVDLPND